MIPAVLFPLDFSLPVKAAGIGHRCLTGRLLQLPDAEKRLIILDPSHPTRSPGINVLESG